MTLAHLNTFKANLKSRMESVVIYNTELNNITKKGNLKDESVIIAPLCQFLRT